MINLPLWVASTGVLTGVCAGVCLMFFLGRHRQGIEDAGDSRNTTFVFSGNLRQTKLLEAIQFLEIGKREGVLHVYCGRRKGYVIFSDGSVVDGFYRNYTGREAVIRMFELEDGDFYFEPKGISQPGLIVDSVMDLAFEWDERRSQES